MKKLLIILAILSVLFTIPIYAKGKKKNKITPLEHEMLTVVRPEARFSNRWCFVIDGSSSIWYKPGRHTIRSIQKAFGNATLYSSDELWFCIYKFHNQGQEKYKKWVQATPETLKEAEDWINKDSGTWSYGKKSIQLALRQKVKRLTIIIITDGGFTSACGKNRNPDGTGYLGDFSEIDKAIQDGQKWRVLKGLGEAIICTIGIENADYFAGGKPNDKNCQAFLMQIGKRYHGGYFLVRKKKSKVPTKKP